MPRIRGSRGYTHLGAGLAGKLITMQETTDFLECAIEIARGAGAILLEGYGTAKAIHHKGTIDLVTEFDRRSEAFIVQALRRHFPDHAIRAEEGGIVSGAGGYEWLVDPLDGTTNFAHNFPCFAVSLALTQAGRTMVAVVYEPVHAELFAATRGGGATLNGNAIHVSQNTALEQCMLATGFPYDLRTNPNNNLAEFHAFLLCAQAVRRPGAAALDLCYTACGRLDGFWELTLHPWDTAAGGLIVEEAGGRVTTAAGNESWLSQPSIVASNKHIHAKMLAVLAATQTRT